MNGFTDGRHHSVGFIREMDGFTDREIFGIPESRIRNPIPRAYLIPYFFRILTIGFLIDSAQRVYP